MRNRIFEISVGLFMLAGLAALFALAFKVSGLTQLSDAEHYVVTAEFDNIGGLKERAPVRVAGVTVGRVKHIKLDPKSFKAEVILWLDKVNRFPSDSSAKILTEGLLGANYICLSPGFEDVNLVDGGVIEDTQPALILENLIGHLLFNVNKKSDKPS